MENKWISPFFSSFISNLIQYVSQDSKKHDIKKVFYWNMVYEILLGGKQIQHALCHHEDLLGINLHTDTGL